LKAGLYVRLSKEDVRLGGEESDSIENQKKLLSEYAQNHDWTIYKIYSDDNMSGKFSDEDDKREGFHNMIEDAKNGLFDIVLCKTQSRFSRNASVVEKYVEHLFREWNIRFVTVIDNADNFDMRNKKARQINSLVNEWFLEDLSENIKEVYMMKMKNGEYLAPFAPFGYKKDENRKNHLVRDEEHSEIVKSIFSMYLSGMSGEKIAEKLNSENVISPQSAIDGKAKPWRGDSVYRILHNRAYIGSTHQHREETYSYKSRRRRKVPPCEQIEIENTHESIIEKDTFNLVQEKLSNRRVKSERKKALFSGILLCGECKKNMHTNTNAYNRRYYRCKNKNCRCCGKGLREDFLTDWLKKEGYGFPERIEASFSDGWSFKICINGR
jgi:DNA invertase Pin-like site-specific DNA recombinase